MAQFFQTFQEGEIAQMAEHSVDIHWDRKVDTFLGGSYSRDHDWDFGFQQTLCASSAAEYGGNEQCVDPEQALVAAIASCHMLTFLALAAKKRFVVDRYEDHAVGSLAKNEEGLLILDTVRLNPVIFFGGEHGPTEEALQKLHEQAHRHCIIANSVKTKIFVGTHEA